MVSWFSHTAKGQTKKINVIYFIFFYEHLRLTEKYPVDLSVITKITGAALLSVVSVTQDLCEETCLLKTSSVTLK